MTTVTDAIEIANSILPGTAAPDGEHDPRWQAIIEVAGFIQAEPDAVWKFASRWGTHEDSDVQAAIATCVLEHLLEHHFSAYWPRVEQLARESPEFARTTLMCWRFGQSSDSQNSEAIDALHRELRGYDMNDLQV